MAKIGFLTDTTEGYRSVGELVIKEREIAVEIATRQDGRTYTIIRRGTGNDSVLDCPKIFDQSAYEDALTTTTSNMQTVSQFANNMNSATAAANTAAGSANSAANLANAAAKACDGALSGMNTMIDMVTQKACVLSIENGLLTIREA